MKTAEDKLFKFIKSLSSEEKRQFKLFWQQKSNQLSYLQLFDAMDSLKLYDEKKLLLILKKKEWMHTLFVIKKYLQEAIFRFLEHHYFDYSVDIQLQRLLQRVEILYSKRLFVSAKKLLRKAEKMATDHHQFLSLLTILSWKRKIMIQQQDVAAVEIYEQEHYVSQLQYIDWYRNLVEYEKIYVQVIRFSMISFGRLDKKMTIELKKILTSPSLKNEKEAHSLPAKIMYYRIFGEIQVLLQNWQKSYVFLQRVVTYSDQAGATPVEKLRAFANLTIPLALLKKSDELFLIKERAATLIKSLPEKLRTNSVHIPYSTIMNNYIHYHISISQVEEALSASRETLKVVEKYASHNFFLTHYSNLSHIYFLKTDYRKALYYASKVLSYEKEGVRQDIISFARLFSLIIHYELGNEDMLPNLCKSYASHFSRQSQQNKAEYVLLNFFGKTIRATPAKKRTDSNKQERIKLFIALKRELELCKTEPILKEFDFLSWAESKIQNRPMIEILKEKSLKVGKV